MLTWLIFVGLVTAENFQGKFLKLAPIYLEDYHCPSITSTHCVELTAEKSRTVKICYPQKFLLNSSEVVTQEL